MLRWCIAAPRLQGCVLSVSRRAYPGARDGPSYWLNKLLPGQSCSGKTDRVVQLKVMWDLFLARFTPRPDTVFRHLRSDRGGGLVRPPWRFQTKRRRASRKRSADCSRRVLAIGGIIFGPRSIFDSVMVGQRSNFRKFYDFSILRVHISKTYLS